jgi:hypothetical protein
MALRHVTATDVDGASVLVLKLIDEQLRSEPMCLNRAVRHNFQRSNSWIIVIIHEELLHIASDESPLVLVPTTARPLVFACRPSLSARRPCDADSQR